jgi:hypothetical protein
MSKNKSTKITFETERHISIGLRRSLFALCEVCADEVRLVTVNEAAAMVGVNSLSIYRLVEAGILHHTETGAGELLICTISLGVLISNQKGQRDMKTISIKSNLLVIVALALIGSVCAIIRVRAQSSTRFVAAVQFGILGITRGQSARINVTNPSSPDNPLFPPDPCHVTISFVDADGNVLLNNSGQPVRRDLMLDPGHSAFLQISLAFDSYGRSLARVDQPCILLLYLSKDFHSLFPLPCLQ